MKLQTALLPALALLAASRVVHAGPHDDDHVGVTSLPSATVSHVPTETPAGGHGHGHEHGSGPPLMQLDEAAIIAMHGVDPPSYWDHDFATYDSRDSTTAYGSLMLAHAVLMSLAFFIVLPLGMAFRSAKHRLHPVVQSIFVVCTILGSLFGLLYKDLTPSMYPGQAHSGMGYIIVILAMTVSTFDALALLSRLFKRVRAVFQPPDSRPAYEAFAGEEYTSLVEEPEQIDRGRERHAHFSNISLDDEKELEPEDKDKTPSRMTHSRTYSTPESTSSTLRDESAHGPRSPRWEDFSRRSSMTLARCNSYEEQPEHVGPASRTTKNAKFHSIVQVLIYAAEWALIASGGVLFISGSVVYTGMCRRSYINSCLAHLIKGGIFFVYGIATFCRYLGAWAPMGWAWNKRPSTTKRSTPTAEMVECTVIFIYGATNMWLERTGAAPGSPYTTKEIQHIGIAVMFAFAGLVGMALESRWVWHLLAESAFNGERPGEEVESVGSFNPMPAIVIGVTGAAMAAHHQTYAFAVQVHALWGNMLVAYSVMRCLTYVTLWLRPSSEAKSVLPRRPPTEALASFFLSCGGLVFIASSEQIVWGAMRAGRDDIMMFMNVVVALTCAIFAWCVIVRATRGWALSQARRQAAPVAV